MIHKQKTSLIKFLKIPVIVVVGIKLGCINDALLTIHRLEQDKSVKVLGWIANQIEKDMLEVNKNIDYLKSNIGCPLLMIINNTDNYDFKNDEFKKITKNKFSFMWYDCPIYHCFCSKENI